MIIKEECSICKSPVEEIIDLGLCPPANNFIEEKGQKVVLYPLIVDFCKQCFCIQLRHCLSKNELYSYYTYSTPKIASLDSHYLDLLIKLKRLGFATHEQSCIEIGSNNGNLLRFLEPHFNEVLGVDPAENIAQIAINNGINKTPAPIPTIPIETPVIIPINKSLFIILGNFLTIKTHMKEQARLWKSQPYRHCSFLH